MGLFKEYLEDSIPDLIEHGIRLHAIGDLNGLPDPVRKALEHDIEISKDNTNLNLILALNYGGREELVASARSIAEQVIKGELQVDQINQEIFAKNLWSSGIPDPDLLIRTSGELRISNFLLWQLAYSEIVVVDDFWPDFNEDTLDLCLKEYSRRERRFGCTSEQIKDGKHLETARKFSYAF
jgi:undecaprenyl diphosphate synthase